VSPAADGPNVAARTPRGGGSHLHERLPVYAAATLLALTGSYLLGRDVLWDTLHYHLYAGFSALHDRFAQDYFAAGAAGYLNPYAYVPFYALVASGLPALAIASVLAVGHSTILWLTYELAVCVGPVDDRRARTVVGGCAVALAFLDPILIQQIGSSFTDISTATLGLAAWVLLARAVRAPRTTWVICAGLLLGVATALKPTNAVHAVAGTALLWWLPRSWPSRLCHGLGYVAAGFLGFIVVAAPWAWRVYRLFGNPLFPLFNNLFPSPGFPAEPWASVRFIPGSLTEALWRPFAMVDPVAMVDQEARMPDVRYAVLAMLGVLLWVSWSLRRLRGHSKLLDVSPADHGARMLLALGSALLLDWVLWLRTSGNSRYLLPMGNVAAVIITALLFRLLAAWPKVRLYAFAGVFAVQLLEVCVGAEYRWDPRPWGGPWLDIDVPHKLATEPSLYLVIGMQSNSFVAPYLARDSGLIDFSGGYALGPDGPGGAHIRKLIRRYQPRLRVLVSGARLYADSEHREPTRSHVEQALARFALRVDPSDCQTITVVGVPPDLEITIGRAKSAEPPPPVRKLLSCHAIPDDTDHAAELAQQRSADRVFDRIEDACPQLFQPRRVLSEHLGMAWQRIYMNTDLEMRISGDFVRFFDPARGDDPKLLGRASEWLAQPPQLVCGRKNGHFFAHVTEPQPAS
jgi:hypothetical protein